MAAGTAPEIETSAVTGRNLGKRRGLGRSTHADHRLPVLSLAVLAIVVLAAILAPVVAPFGEQQGVLGDRLVGPFSRTDSGLHLLGTDSFGRDIASRLLYGARVSIAVGIMGVAIACVAGTMVGIAAGLLGGVPDAGLMRLVDVVLSVPPILFAIVVAAVITPSLTTILLTIGFLFWPNYARLVRAEVLSLRDRDFIAYARVAGCSSTTIALRHIVPNVLPSVIVLATFQVGTAIVIEASLSFLGLGIPPDKASWGGMVNDGRGVIEVAWWVPTFSGLAIFLTVFALNRIGDWSRVRFDPRLAGTR